MSEIKLLPCPFCGGEAEIKDSGSGTYKIECENDCVAGNNHFLRKDIKVLCDAWNTRKPMERIIERLKTELVLSDKERERCSREDSLQFDMAKGYANGIANAIEILKEEGDFNV